MARAALLILCFASLGLLGKAEAVVPKISSVQINGIWAFQAGSTGDSVSGQFAWTPIFDLGTIGFRGELGLTLLKNALGDRFLVPNYEAFLRIGIMPSFTWEAGGGFQTWSGGNGGTKPCLSTNLAFGLVGTLDRIFFGYSHLFLGAGVNEYKLGVGLVF